MSGPGRPFRRRSASVSASATFFLAASATAASILELSSSSSLSPSLRMASVAAYQQPQRRRRRSVHASSTSISASSSSSSSSAAVPISPPVPKPSLPGIQPRKVHRAPHIRRVLCVSDVHTDHDANLRWAEETLGEGDHGNDESLLLVAGDVSHDLSVVRRTLAALKSKFGEVAYVPGNHDLWVHEENREEEEEGAYTSVDKLIDLLRLCDELDVRTGPMRCGDEDRSGGGGGGGGRGVWVVPLLSWHHNSFDTEPDIDPSCWGGIPSIERCMVDYRRAKWPNQLSMHDDSVAQYVDGLNDCLLGNDNFDAAVGSDGTPVLTFSHFLPRIELTPEKRYLFVPTLNKAVGSSYLESRLRRMGSALHVFGHTHFGWDQSIEGVRYVQAALAYPWEREQRARSLRIGTMAPNGDSGQGEEDGGDGGSLRPVCVWEAVDCGGDGDVSEGGFPDGWLGGYWSDRYAHVPRTPEVTWALAPWVAERYRKLPGGEVEEFVRHTSTREPPIPR